MIICDINIRRTYADLKLSILVHIAGVNFQHSTDSGESVYNWIFVRNIIPYNYNAIICVMVRVIRYSRELVFQEAVLYALTVCRHPLR